MGKQRKAKALRRYARALEALANLHDPLAYRKLRGEQLTEDEERTLGETRAALNRALPRQAGLTTVERIVARAEHRLDELARLDAERGEITDSSD